MFHELKYKIPEMFHTHKKSLFLSNVAHTFVYSLGSEHSYFVKIHLTGVAYQYADYTA
jgi:hypothetical protein